MATTATITPAPRPVVLNVSVEDIAVARDIKRFLRRMHGVTKVTMPRNKRLSGLELSELDKQAGRITEYASVDDYFKSLGV